MLVASVFEDGYIPSYVWHHPSPLASSSSHRSTFQVFRKSFLNTDFDLVIVFCAPPQPLLPLQPGQLRQSSSKMVYDDWSYPVWDTIPAYHLTIEIVNEYLTSLFGYYDFYTRVSCGVMFHFGQLIVVAIDRPLSVLDSKESDTGKLVNKA
jgi:hypothetical protein